MALVVISNYMMWQSELLQLTKISTNSTKLPLPWLHRLPSQGCHRSRNLRHLHELKIFYLNSGCLEDTHAPKMKTNGRHDKAMKRKKKSCLTNCCCLKACEELSGDGHRTMSSAIDSSHSWMTVQQLAKWQVSKNHYREWTKMGRHHANKNCADSCCNSCSDFDCKSYAGCCCNNCFD
jgi:hypothetical protein